MVIWMLAPLCLMWCLWRERNARSFEDIEILVMSYEVLCSALGYHHIIAWLFLVLQIF